MRSDLISGPRPSRPEQRPPLAVESLPGGGAAAAIAPLLSHFFGGPPPVRVRFWDGTSLGPTEGDTLQVCSPDAVRRMLWSPSELGLARAFVEGGLAFEGDIFEMLALLHAASPPRVRTGSRLPWPAVRAAHRLGALGPPLPPPPEEAAPRGRLHSRTRDAQAVRHHYDVSNDFYAMVLGPAMTYSCARFTSDADTLEAAQESKHDLICRKLGLPDRGGTANPRCRLWMGQPGHPRGEALRCAGCRRDPQSGASALGARPGRGSRVGPTGRDPAAGLP